MNNTDCLDVAYDTDSQDNANDTFVGIIGKRLLHAQVQIQDRSLKALIDTGAEVTIMQDKVFDGLPTKPEIIKEATLRGAFGSTKTCRVTNPILFRIGDLLFSNQFRVAPIDCGMVLGYDFLKLNQAILKMGKKSMVINEKIIPLVLGEENPERTKHRRQQPQRKEKFPTEVRPPKEVGRRTKTEPFRTRAPGGPERPTLIVFVYQGAKKLATATSVAKARKVARDKFGLDGDVTLYYLGIEMGDSVQLDLLPLLPKLEIRLA